MQEFYGFTRESLAQFLKEKFNAPSYRAVQLFKWVYRQRTEDLDQMSDLSALLREQLKSEITFTKPAIESCQLSKDGTKKYLFKLAKGEGIESVLIKQPKRITLCVSSQVGCGMGCSFCRTATMGFRRHLSTAEIIQQVISVDNVFSNIVFMGMGEPLHNYEGISKAVAILTDQHGLAIPPRKITVSTVGLVPAIRKFIKEVPASLAVSLNATTDEVRSKIMPVNKRFKIEDLIAALKEHPNNPRKKVTIEYVMLSGVNDTIDDLKRLPKLLRDIPAKVNLIPYNENAGLGFKAPSREHVAYWRDQLVKKNLSVTVRWSKGVDISAACGQLATESGRVKA